MAEPRFVTERKNHSTNQTVGVTDSPKNLSQKTADHFSAQNINIKNKSMGSARDAIANKLSATSASNDGSYPKCSSVSINPCIVTGGYIDKRAYSGSGMAGWKEAGLTGNTNNQLSVGAGANVDIFLFAVGASGEIAKRIHGDSICTDLTACIQLGLGLHAGVGLSATTGAENIKPTKFSTSVGGFGNFFSAGGAVTISDTNISGGKGVYGLGAGASGGLQACATASISCKNQSK